MLKHCSQLLTHQVIVVLLILLGAGPGGLPARAAENPPAAEESGMSGLGMAVHYGSVRATFQLTGDLGFRYDNPPPSGFANGSFSFGNIIIFTTANLGDHFQVLNEIAVKSFSNTTGEIRFDAERLWGMWTFGDYLSMKLGLEHTPVTHWNRRHHHAKYFWLTAEHPLMARFEFELGPLPIHYTGLEMTGRLTFPIGRFEYLAAYTNGRGRKFNDLLKVLDSNAEKAIDFGLGFSPSCLGGLTLGGNFHADTLAPDPPGRARSNRELISTVYLEYQSGQLEALAEGAWIEHKDLTTSQVFNHGLAYAQLGYRVGDLTPYTRFDIRMMGRGDSYYTAVGLDLDAWEQVLGVRYELSDNSALKVEGGYGNLERRSTAGVVTREPFASINAQLSWVL